MKTYIGCSGYQYEDWKGKFYPESLSKEEWLPYYAEHFNSVEINGTFYRIPEDDTFKKWYNQVPGNFKFTLKGSQYVTHMKKLNDPKEPLQKFYNAAESLGGKIGCILWQLPGNLHKDVDKLEAFCQSLSADFNNVMEFRDNSWYSEEVYAVLKKYEVSFCIISAPENLSDAVVKTAKIAYMRFHGKEEWYKDFYTKSELSEWAEKLNHLKGLQNRYIYFNNDFGAKAPEDAKIMQELFNE